MADDKYKIDDRTDQGYLNINIPTPEEGEIVLTLLSDKAYTVKANVTFIKTKNNNGTAEPKKNHLPIIIISIVAALLIAAAIIVLLKMKDSKLPKPFGKAQYTYTNYSTVPPEFDEFFVWDLTRKSASIGKAKTLSVYDLMKDTRPRKKQ